MGKFRLKKSFALKSKYVGVLLKDKDGWATYQTEDGILTVPDDLDEIALAHHAIEGPVKAAKAEKVTDAGE